jgi:hypothetical protein
MQTKKFLIALEVVVVFLGLTVYLWFTIQSTQKQKQAQALDISASHLKNGIDAFLMRRSQFCSRSEISGLIVLASRTSSSVDSAEPSSVRLRDFKRLNTEMKAIASLG